MTSRPRCVFLSLTRLPLVSTLLAMAALSLAALSLTGCATSFAPTVADEAAPLAAPGPAISGSVYGGHAPIVNAKVYVLTPSTTANAGLATSRMNSTSAAIGGYPVTKDTSGGVSNGMYYVTTDGNGNFNITGDYTCVANQPVYVVAVGGSPQTPNSSKSSITGLSVGATTGNGTTQTATLTFTTAANPTQLYFIGETVTLTGFTGALSYLNNSVQTVLSAGLTTTTFETTTGTWNGTANITGNYTGLTATGTANPPNNPAAINMAALGLCPSGGTFAGNISFIYMNEISTAALAYATAAFGTDAFHIGVNQSGPLNTAGPTGASGYVTGSMAQAFNNAYLLYDITGGNLSTTYAGEGHIARAVTPPNNGTVPQAKLDTIGNILAACVDSPNTNVSTSTQCATLFGIATANGKTSGTQPTDIATVAFNMAHYPAGTGNANYAMNLFNIPAGNVPFAPNLGSAPSDFTLNIQFTINSASGGTNNLISNPQILSVDGEPYTGLESGTSSPANAVWVGSYSAQPVKLFTNGTPDYATNAAANFAAATRSRSVAVDPGNNVWVMNEATGVLQQFSDTGTLLLTINQPTNPYVTLFTNAVNVALDSSTNVYASYEDITAKFTSAGVNIPYNGGAANAIWSTNNAALGGTAYYTHNGYFDANGLYYTITTDGNSSLCVANPGTAACNQLVGGFTIGTASNALTFSALDANNTFWSTAFYSNSVLGYNYYTQPGSIAYTFTGGGLNQPAATAIDGAGNIWVANAGNASLSAFTNTGTALSPTTGFAPLSFASTNSADLVIDRAGDVWVVYSGANYVDEVIGIATPAVGPTQYATFHSGISVRPY